GRHARRGGELMSPADVAALIDDIDIIDSDTHVIEPYDLWTSRLSTEKGGNLIPHVRWDAEAQEEVWYFGDKKIYAAGLASGAGWNQFPPDHPNKLADSPVRNYDPVKRLEH